MTSAEYVECERIHATVGDDVWLDEQEWRRLESGRIIYIDRITGKQLQPNQCGLLDYGRNGGKYRHFRLLSVMLRQSY